MRPKVIDLFAGVGGLSLGFEQQGFDVVLANEYDASIAAAYQQNHKNTKIDVYKRQIFCFYNTDTPHALHFPFSPSFPPINDQNNMESNGNHSVPVLSLESAFLHLPLMQTPCFF